MHITTNLCIITITIIFISQACVRARVRRASACTINIRLHHVTGNCARAAIRTCNNLDMNMIINIIHMAPGGQVTWVRTGIKKVTKDEAIG